MADWESAPVVEDNQRPAWESAPVVEQQQTKESSLHRLLFSREAAENLRSEIQEAVKSIPSMATQIGSGLLDVAKFQVGTPQQRTQAIANFTGQAVQQGRQLTSDIQSPLGTRESFRGIIGAGMLAAPALGLLSETLRPILGKGNSPVAATEGEVIKSATQERQIQKGIQPERIGTAQGENVPAYAPQVREAGGEQAGRGDSIRAAAQTQEIAPVPQPEQAGEVLFPTDDLNFRGGEATKTNQVIGVKKMVNDQGQTVYAIRYTAPDGTGDYLGYSANGAWEYHQNFGKGFGQTAAPDVQPVKSMLGGKTQAAAEVQRVVEAQANALADIHGSENFPRPVKPVSEAGQAPAVVGQPKIVSTAINTPEGIKRGITWNQPHDEIAKGITPAAETPTTIGEVTPKGQATVPDFAKRYNPETLFVPPRWAFDKYGKAFEDKIFGLIRAKSPVAAADVTPIWKVMTPSERQELLARGFSVTNTRIPGQVALLKAKDAVAAKSYYRMQEKRGTARVETARPSPTQETGVSPPETPTTTGVVTPEMEHLRKGITNWYDPNAPLNPFGQLNEDGSVSIPVQRFGVANTDAVRGGTWYELNRGGVSDYNALPETGAAKLVGNVATKYGVGGKERVESEVRTRNPFLINATNLHEGQYPLSLAKKVLTDAEFRKAKRGITGANAEAAYSRLEKLTSQRLQEQGHDAVIFYHKYDYGSIPHQVFKLPQEGVLVPEGGTRAIGGAAGMTFDEFSASRGVPATPPSFPELHRAPGGVSKPSARAAAARIEAANQEWQTQRNALQQEYQQKIQSGEIREPTRIERLQRTAQGTGEAAEAAKRLLSKRQVQPVSATGETPAATPQGIPEEQKGFIIQNPDGTTREVWGTEGRKEAATIAKAAGQVKPENADTTALHSQQLQEAPETAAAPSTVDHPAVADFKETTPSSRQSLGLLPRPSEFVRQDVAKVVTGISKGIRQIRAALTPANVSPIAGQTARIVREHAGQLARDREIATVALQDAAQILRRNSKAENLAIIDRLEKGQSLGNKGLDDYRTIRQSAYDQRIKQVQEVNPKAMQDLIENYFPHIWTRESIERLAGSIDKIPADNAWARIFGKRPLAGPGSFLKQRTIPTTAEGIALGLEPVTTNPVALDLLKMGEMDRYVMGHRLVQELKDNNLMPFVPAGERPDFGHIKIDDRIARVYGPRGWKIVDEQGRQMPGQKVLGDYYAPEDVARIINNYTSPGLRGNAIYDAFRLLGNTMNQVQLGISAYHAFFTAIDSATSTIALGLEQIARSGGSATEIAKGAGQIAKGFVETPVGSMIENLWRGNKFLREYSKPGTTNAELAKIVDAATAGGARVRMDTFYNTGAVEKFFDAMKSGNYTGAILRAPLAAIQTVAKPLMEYAVPRMKLGIISQNLEYELGRLPKNVTQDQIRTIAGRVVDSVDNRMGQLIYDNLFWNKTLKDGLMASVRSVGWNLGDIRELGGGALDSITAPKRAYTALTKGTEIADNPVFTKRMAYTFALPFYVGVLGSVYQYLMTGKGPQSVQDMFMPRTGRLKADGTEERVMLPTYMKDVYPLALATAREGAPGLVSRGYRMAVNKLHPALSSIGQMIHNQDYYGNQILSPDDPLIQQHPTMGKIYREAEFIGKQFQPFSFRGVAQREGGLKEKAQAVAGIMPATRELTDTPAMRMIHDINVSKRPAGGYTKLQQQKREDRRQAQSGEDLRPTLFKRLSNEEKARVLEVATPEERAIFQSGTGSRSRIRR